ncbi:hypothetical protein ACFXTH_000905 [Malus domestica]
MMKLPFLESSVLSRKLSALCSSVLPGRYHSEMCYQIACLLGKTQFNQPQVEEQQAFFVLTSGDEVAEGTIFNMKCWSWMYLVRRLRRAWRWPE